MITYDFDMNDHLFSDQFKKVRAFYKLTAREMAALLNYKSSANIAYFEKYPMTNKPTFELILKLHQLFGLTTDLLLGLNKIPYTEESVKKAEASQFSRLSANYINQPKLEKYTTPENIMFPISVKLFPAPKERQNTLILQDRFTLIFLLNYTEYALEKYYEQNRTKILKEESPNLTELIGNKEDLYSPITKIQGITPIFQKHPEYTS